MKLERLILIAVLLTITFSAYAASLGRLTVISDLDQPLIAEIDLQGVNVADLVDYSAQLASEQAYRIQGIEKTPPQNSIRVEVIRKADNTPALKLTSGQAIHSTSMNILVQLDWPNGRTMREYALLLEPSKVANAVPTAIDSVVFTRNRIAQPVEETPPGKITARYDTLPLPTAGSSPVSQEPIKSAPKPEIKPEPLEATSKAESKMSESGVSKGYTTEKGDTLHKIAQRMQVDGVSLDQMLQALYLANKDAFIDGDVNKLKTGVELKSPSAADFQAATAPAVTAQSDDWHSYRNKVASLATEGNANEEGAERLPPAGKIGKVEDKAVAGQEGPRDVLKLSRTDLIDEKWLNREAQFEQEKQTLEEEITVRDNRLSEANQRILALEKQVQDMHLLLEKNRIALAEQQKLHAESVSFTSTLRDLFQKPSDGMLAAIGAIGLLLAILILRLFAGRKTRSLEL